MLWHLKKIVNLKERHFLNGLRNTHAFVFVILINFKLRISRKAPYIELVIAKFFRTLKRVQTPAKHSEKILPNPLGKSVLGLRTLPQTCLIAFFFVSGTISTISIKKLTSPNGHIGISKDRRLLCYNKSIVVHHNLHLYPKPHQLSLKPLLLNFVYRKSAESNTHAHGHR